MKIYQKQQDVVSKSVDGEEILLDLSTGTYFNLNAVGSHVWNCLNTQTTLDNIVNSVVENFDVDPELALKDISKLLVDLKQSNLIQ